MARREVRDASSGREWVERSSEAEDVLPAGTVASSREVGRETSSAVVGAERPAARGPIVSAEGSTKCGWSAAPPSWERAPKEESGLGLTGAKVDRPVENPVDPPGKNRCSQHIQKSQYHREVGRHQGVEWTQGDGVDDWLFQCVGRFGLDQQ